MNREEQVFAFLRGLVWLAVAVVLSIVASRCARAGTCPDPPLFEMSGPDCTAQNQTIECRCSECMSWDPEPAAGWYEVYRQDPGSQTLAFIGSTAWRNKPEWTDDDGVVHPATFPTMWCFAWDYSLPAEGQLYLYRVKTCTNGIVNGSPGSVCSDFTPRSIDYRAAPYTVIP